MTSIQMSGQASRIRCKDLLKPGLTSDIQAVVLPRGPPSVGDFFLFHPAEPSSKTQQAPLRTALFSLAKRLALIRTSAPYVELPPRL